ncbi:hypothetical protein [Cucumibacter marinus]|uniref:hypothetical protein n=1 Tax=Cucumibacter marinus TaxID=1121252 RepID=UPI00041E0B1B|nr:hypothetical protein [Cucumibacter marinus]
MSVFQGQYTNSGTGVTLDLNAEDASKQTLSGTLSGVLGQSFTVNGSYLGWDTLHSRYLIELSGHFTIYDTQHQPPSRDYLVTLVGYAPASSASDLVHHITYLQSGAFDMKGTGNDVFHDQVSYVSR